MGSDYELEDTLPTVDWLVIAQLSTCLLGGILGGLLMRKHFHFGFGTKALLVYLMAVVSSTVFSLDRNVSIGYWVLLAGTSLLTIGLVQRAQTQRALSQLENAWLLTLSLLLFKDMIIGLLFSETQQSDSEVFRLGMGVTHANAMGLLSVLGFWISFKKQEISHPILLWLLRLLFLLIIILSRSRTSMICLAMGGIVRALFQIVYQPRQSLSSLIAIPCCFMAALALSFELPGTATAVQFFTRGEDIHTIKSLTGRTEIWQYAIERVFDGPLSLSLLFGHGYGVSRLILNEGGGAPAYFVHHAHNAFLESLLTTGLLGAIPFIVLVIYSITWLIRFQQLHREFSSGFALRAVSVVSIALISSIIEPYLSSKIGPVTVIYIFYLLALDQRRYLRRYLIRPVDISSIRRIA
jgi:O-antigen ligase